MKWLKKILLALLGLLAIIILLFIYAVRTHVDIGRFKSWEKGASIAPAQPQQVTAQFVGVSTLLFSDGNTHILIDGYFTRPSATELIFGKIAPDEAAIKWGLKRLGVTTLDAILVVHSHFDHAMDAPIVAQLTGAPVYGSASTANICRGLDLSENSIRLFENNRTISLGDFRVTPILSKHYEFANERIRARALGGSQEITEPLIPPVKPDAYKMGGAYTLYFEHPSGSFLLQSSAGWKENTLDSIQADVVLLGIGGLGAQTQAYQETYFEQIVDQVQPKEVLLIHWDALSGSIRKPIQGEVLLIDKLMGKTVAGFEAVEREMAKRAGVSVYILPQWEKRTLLRSNTF